MGDVGPGDRRASEGGGGGEVGGGGGVRGGGGVGEGGGVQVVVVHHDQPERCARNVLAFLAQPDVAGVWVAESSSDPNARRRLRNLVPDVEIIEGRGNVGFGPGANLGLRRWLAAGDGEWVAVAPHDAAPAPDCVTRLLAAARARPGAGLLSAEFGPEFGLVPAYDKVIGGYYRPAARGVGWEDVDYPHGTLLLARRATLEEIGLFDERYFAYCEEVDLGLRATRAGWDVGLVWGATVTNGSLPARPVADYLQLRNTLLLIDSHQGRREVRVRMALAVAHHVAGALRHPAGALTRSRPAAMALADFHRRRFGPPPAAIVTMSSRAGRRGAILGRVRSAIWSRSSRIRPVGSRGTKSDHLEPC